VPARDSCLRNGASRAPQVSCRLDGRRVAYHEWPNSVAKSCADPLTAGTRATLNPKCQASDCFPFENNHTNRLPILRTDVQVRTNPGSTLVPPQFCFRVPSSCSKSPRLCRPSACVIVVQRCRRKKRGISATPHHHFLNFSSEVAPPDTTHAYP
jgi:hypothetical protein